MILRKYETEDLDQIAELFYQTVHTVNCRDYSPRQLAVWATGQVDLERWNASLSSHYSIVAVKDGRITGFGDIDKKYYLDRLYVHKDYQGQGIASAICDKLEKYADGNGITVHASITARPFFERRGYRLLKEQQMKRGGIFLTNFIMEKSYGAVL